MINPPGSDDPTLDPPPLSEEEEHERRRLIPLSDLVAWYVQHGISLDVPLHDWRPEVEGRGER
jgi:hypothetical protein